MRRVRQYLTGTAASAALHRPTRCVMAGQFPTDGGNTSAANPQGWELRRGHHLQSSVGLHSPIVTACGRSFNPQLYYEVLQACCDEQWLNAIQRELRSDAEYIEFLRENGGAAKDLRRMTDGCQHDDEMMLKLRGQLKSDKKLSLTLCAVQDSYQRIREKRDKYETEVAAGKGRDSYATTKYREQREFGAQYPRF